MSETTINPAEITRDNAASFVCPADFVEPAKTSGRYYVGADGQRILLLTAVLGLLADYMPDTSKEDDDIDSAVVRRDPEGPLPTVADDQLNLSYPEVRKQVFDMYTRWENVMNAQVAHVALRYAALSDPVGALSVYPEANTLLDVLRLEDEELRKNENPMERIMQAIFGGRE